MRELSLNILDIVQNSITAGATKIEITVSAKTTANILIISIADNGCGMSKELLERVSDPFTTTRTTRKVGLGIPLFRQGAESANGSFNISSQLGVGTTITARYQLDHIDRMPLGSLPDTMSVLLMGNGAIRFILRFSVDERQFIFDTDEVKEQIGGLPLDTPEIMEFLREYLNQNINTTNGGIL